MSEINCTFWGLLNNPDINGIIIPKYQRDYAQGRDHTKKIAKKFIADLHEILLSKDELQQLSLGLIYTCLEKDSRKLHIVDGQQRFTILWLLHLFLGKNSDGNISNLSKFQYKTRSAAERFCEYVIKVKCNKLTKNNICNDRKFSKEWQLDPTVSNMLEVIDILNKYFPKEVPKEEYSFFFNKLIGQECPVKFDYLQLVGVTSDNIYMQMNSRGLDLSDFECFKSDLIKVVNDETLIFDKKIDGDYTNFIWKILGNKKNDKKAEILDSCLANYIEYYARFKAFRENHLFKSDMSNREEWINWFSDVSFRNNFEKDTDALIKFMPEKFYDKISGWLSQSNYKNQSYLYALLSYLRKIEDAVNWELLFFDWWHLVKNVITHTDIGAENYSSILRLIDHLKDLINFDPKYNFYEVVSETNFESQNKQWLQEKVKATLIKDEKTTKDDIWNAEKIKAFSGNLNFLLSFDNTIADNFENEKFKLYTEIARLLFDKEKCSRFLADTHLLTRAILTYNPRISNTIYLFDSDQYFYKDMNGSSAINTSKIELLRATRALILDIVKNDAFSDDRILAFLEKRITMYQSNDVLWIWRLVHYPDLLSSQTSYRQINKDEGRMRLYNKANRNWQDFDLDGEHCEDIVQLYKLFEKKSLLGNIYRKDGDVFYKGWSPMSFFYNNIEVTVVITNGLVKFGIKTISKGRDIFELQQMWPKSENSRWASFLSFPIGSFNDRKEEIIRYKDALSKIQ